MNIGDLLPWIGLALTIGGMVVGAAMARTASSTKLNTTVTGLVSDQVEDRAALKALDARTDALEQLNVKRAGIKEGMRLQRERALLESSSTGIKTRGDRPVRRDHDETGEFER